ncbi:MAG: formiminotetrahydrofolate cyclodeaminase [Planctomycetota bacterium]|jgi:formiminotetrahydrofolate cyclodeaminase
MNEQNDVFASLKPFLTRLKSDAPTPGGGAVAGLLGALAAALSHMVASLTVDKKKYAEHRQTFQEAMPKMETAIESFYGLMLADVEVFDQYMAALKLPKSTDSEKTIRKTAMRNAAKEAARVPMESLILANEILPLVQLAADFGNKNAISDAGMAAILVNAAARSAALNVRINLSSMPEEDAAPRRAQLEGLLASTLGHATAIEDSVANAL